MMRTPLLLAALLITCSPAQVSAQVPAFPGAEGAGAMSLGGRGGRIIRVTNLEDSGPGSLRAAIETLGPRIVIFDVGGTISLKSPLAIRYGRVTVAGQTAPGGGITLRNYTFGVHSDDVVVRFIRSRMGADSGFVGDALSVTFGNRVVLDHVSASWSTDESLSVAQGYKRPGVLLGDVTVQWSIISESLCKSVNPDGRHCYGSIIGGSRGAHFTFHHNLWALHAARSPRLGNSLPPGQDPLGGFFDLRDNVIYGWGGHIAGYGGLPAGKVTFNLVDNAYISGPEGTGNTIFKEGNPAAQAYIAGNTINGKVQQNGLDGVIPLSPAGYLLPSAAPFPAVRTQAPVTATQQVLALAGDSLHRDSVDTRVIADVRNRTGRLIDTPQDVGGWPELARGTPWVDTDGDGMPDDWERAHGLNPRDPRDGNADRDGDGYTNVENWLNDLAAPMMPH